MSWKVCALVWCRYVNNPIPLGHLGKFTLSLHWMNLGNQPVEILVEDVYLLVVPSPQSNVDPDEEERRAQAAKAERLENAELLHMRGQAEISSGARSDLARVG
jgi:vacuolar protein sorting-associated protein 13A/C